ncbi:hypothetical protein C4157_11135 [Clostridioides difficile]|nr:hypothetical protein DDG61_04365 [Clostridioides difficile]CCL04637.1 conserved hypothetical protein [Clostridioides difficile E13]CCL05908.1 conserved hypothetical protein [Clostridioides difficile CD002]EGT3923211.1 hypothetical protein [Clostridioides difficile]EGT4038375.1 hypothetical protein [Clostridioides difficile]
MKSLYKNDFLDYLYPIELFKSVGYFYFLKLNCKYYCVIYILILNVCSIGNKLIEKIILTMKAKKVLMKIKNFIVPFYIFFYIFYYTLNQISK